jgi:DNA-binding CsgD family transcriptional regulator
MSTLTDSEYQKLTTNITELYHLNTLESLPNGIRSIIKQLVPADSSSCVSFQNQAMELISCDIDLSNFIANLTPAYFQRHPILAYHLQTGDWSAFKCSDFLTEAQYHHCDAIYENAYKAYEIEDFFMFSVPDPIHPPNYQEWSLPWLLNELNDPFRLQEIVQSQNTLNNLGLGLYRSDRSFTETDRTLLNILRPHIFRTYQYAQHYTLIQHQIAQLTELTEFLGLAILSIEGQIKLLTNRAIRLLEHYFPAEWSNRYILPESLHQYCQQQIQKLRQPDTAPLLPALERKQDNHRLIVQFIPDRPESKIILLFEEYVAAELSIDTFRRIGLTKRQSEVLFYLTQGKTNKEIAQLLGRDAKTIKKHLDGIYATLQVNGRIAAVSSAYNQLGRLRLIDDR